MLVCRSERNHGQEVNERAGTTQLRFLFGGKFSGVMAIKETFVHLHSTKQTIPHKLLKLIAEGLYPFLTVV